MTSTIKVNNVQNQCGQNIINENSNTITIGASGDTIALASGASQTGFGRTGTVDWQTSIKTSTITAVNGEGYFVNTTGGAITANLPAGSAGAIVAFRDYAGTFNSNSLTIAANGSEKIENSTADFIVGVNNESLTLIYADATKGWLVVNDGNADAGAAAGFISATGGCIATSGDYKIHTFTGPGTFTVTSGGGPTAVADYLVVAGGGSAGNNLSGGGGGGGFRESVPSPAAWTASPLANPGAALSITPGSYPIQVGAGGAQSPTINTQGNSGSPSIFRTITSAGGGTGGGGDGPGKGGVSGGSGGGASGYAPVPTTGGTGNTPPVSPPQGSNGGAGGNGPAAYPGAGGGGGTAVGATPPNSSSAGGNGGAGAQTQIDTNNYYYSGGGGGGSYSPSPAGGNGGLGGGGGGGKCSPGSAGTGGGTARNTGQNGNPSGVNGGAGGANTGGGGGGSGHQSGNALGGAGGSGIVVIRYKFQ